MDIQHVSSNSRSKAQFLRYLLVGACNTVFGLGLFVAFNLAFRSVPRGYVLASVTANLVAITLAFFAYKWFVFRTRGNYFKEWLRCIAVYATSIVGAAAGVAFLVPILQRGPRVVDYAPYIAAALMAGVTVVASFFGHKHFSFRKLSPELP